MSFLEKEEEKSSALWDWVVGIALLLAVTGFTFFYQYQKRESRQLFNFADSLFHQGQYRDAVLRYEALKDAQYLTTSHDSIIYARLDSVETMIDREREALGKVRSKLAAGDTAGAKKDLSAQVFHGLLEPGDSAAVDTLKQLFGL